MLFEFELTPEPTFLFKESLMGKLEKLQLLQIFTSIVEKTPSTKLKTSRVPLGECALIHKTLQEREETC